MIEAIKVGWPLFIYIKLITHARHVQFTVVETYHLWVRAVNGHSSLFPSLSLSELLRRPLTAE